MCELVREDDGLPTWGEGGLWTKAKLYFWYRYLDITTTAMVGNPRWPGGVVYVDLFAGAGVCTPKESNERIPGSILIAANMTKPFTRVVGCEAVKEVADACRARLATTPVASRCHLLMGDCNERIGQVVDLIPAGSLTLAFIDPNGLDAKFATIATLSEHRNVDFVMLFADAYDLPRNLERLYRRDPNSKLDQVLGLDSRWRERLDELPNPTGANKRKLFRRIYEEQLRNHLGYVHIRHKAIESPNGPIYTLVYASKHKLGLKFWDEALKKEASGQRTFPFTD
ncbi:three-Cys-motif partner protein TcmP [bacterium]|nr:three-Cys-motif partner protein TcmP [bacterium]